MLETFKPQVEFYQGEGQNRNISLSMPALVHKHGSKLCTKDTSGFNQPLSNSQCLCPASVYFVGCVDAQFQWSIKPKGKGRNAPLCVVTKSAK